MLAIVLSFKLRLFEFEVCDYFLLRRRLPVATGTRFDVGLNFTLELYGNEVLQAQKVLTAPNISTALASVYNSTDTNMRIHVDYCTFKLTAPGALG